MWGACMSARCRSRACQDSKWEVPRVALTASNLSRCAGAAGHPSHVCQPPMAGRARWPGCTEACAGSLLCAQPRSGLLPKYEPHCGTTAGSPQQVCATELALTADLIVLTGGEPAGAMWLECMPFSEGDLTAMNAQPQQPLRAALIASSRSHSWCCRPIQIKSQRSLFQQAAVLDWQHGP